MDLNKINTIYSIYHYIKKSINPLDFLYLPLEQALEKFLIYTKFYVNRDFNAIFYEENEELIKSIVKIILNDSINCLHVYQSGIEEVINYNDKWNKIRNPDVDAPVIENPVNLKIELYDYQKAILYAMDFAEKQEFVFDGEKKLTSNAACLSSGIGTGKTIMILAHILRLKEQPFEIKRDIMFSCSELMNVQYIPKKFIKANIIFVNSNVCNQWREEINIRTQNLNVVYIYDAYDLKKVINNINLVYEADVIIVKCSEVSSNYVASWEEPVKSKTRHLMNAISSLFKDCMFYRMYIDDFDTIKITENVGGIHAQFYWYISATCLRGRQSRKHEFAIAPYPKNTTKWLFNSMSISATKEFIDKCNILPKIKVFVTNYHSANSGFMSVMANAAKNDPILGDIMEMLNGDCIESAADKLGIRATSVHDVFKKILDRSFGPYLHALKILESVKVLKHLEILKGFNSYHLGPEKIKQINYAARSNKYKFTLKDNKEVVIIKEDKQPEFVISDLDKDIKDFNSLTLNHGDSELEQLIKRLEESANNQKNKEGAAIDKLRRSQTECQTCKRTLYDDDEPMDEDIKGAIAMPCCGKMFCSDCAIKGAQFIKKNNIVYGFCPACRIEIKPNQMIFISIKGELGNKLLEDTLTDIKDSFDPNNVKDSFDPNNVKEEIVEFKNPKFEGLIQIISGELPKKSVLKKIEFNSLMNGNKDVPIVNQKPKVLIIAKYIENIKEISLFLEEKQIGYIRLQGNSSEKRNQINKLRDDENINVMLLATSSDCAGLVGLEFITDCVFMHRLISKEIEAQSIGRCQRLGRNPEIPLRVHYLLYDYELEF